MSDIREVSPVGEGGASLWPRGHSGQQGTPGRWFYRNTLVSRPSQPSSSGPPAPMPLFPRDSATISQEDEAKASVAGVLPAGPSQASVLDFLDPLL